MIKIEILVEDRLGVAGGIAWAALRCGGEDPRVRMARNVTIKDPDPEDPSASAVPLKPENLPQVTMREEGFPLRHCRVQYDQPEPEPFVQPKQEAQIGEGPGA